MDGIPERAGDWQTRTLSFKDLPNDEFTVRFRDPVEAIKSLWGDPDLSPHMVYAPSKVYADKEQNNHIYTEMWTGQWWHVLQVGTLFIIYFSSIKIRITVSHQSNQKRCHCRPCHHCDR